MGCSQWEGIGGRGDALLNAIPGGDKFAGRTYSDIEAAEELEELAALLESEGGQEAQMTILASDCLDMYVPVLNDVLNNDVCKIYAGTWCPTSHYVVGRFIQRRRDRGYDVDDLQVLSQLFHDQYCAAAEVGEEYEEGYMNRANNTLNYVSNLDLTGYGIA